VGIISGNGGGGGGLAIPFDVTGGNTELAADAGGTLTLTALTPQTAELDLGQDWNANFVRILGNGGVIAHGDTATVLAGNLAADSGAGISPKWGVISWRNTAPADSDLFPGGCALWYDPTNGASKLMVKAQQADGTVKTAAIALA
jgi:hypothetical protein